MPRAACRWRKLRWASPPKVGISEWKPHGSL
jgi:hypothetical protein